MLLRLIFLIILNISLDLYGNEPATKDCSKLKNSCEYYLCLETQKKCGESGYLKSFGHKYCHRFQTYTSKTLSHQGKIWLRSVRSCLIDELTKMDPALSCQQLKQNAFYSHAPCYIKTKFCNLKLKDKYKIIKAIGRGSMNRHAMASGIRVLRSCRLVRWY
jgi:hypothetical protein